MSSDCLLGVDPQIVLDAFAELGLVSWLGVPDSTLASLLAALAQDSRFDHLRATNECEAVAIAMGQYLASGEPSVVYLQNSGFGKTIHPITSLLAREICAVPVLLLIGWRGEPGGKPDEPQHKLMGRVMPALLDAIAVPFRVLSSDADAIGEEVAWAKAQMAELSSTVALVVRPGLIGPDRRELPDSAYLASASELTRRLALAVLIESLPTDAVVVSTTGKASRELFFLREEAGLSHASDFYTVGGMGCASSIALGIARKLKQAGMERTVCVVDGDGAALMQLGTMATLGDQWPSNLLHFLVDNGAYESTGGQASISGSVDFCSIAKACGYGWVTAVDSVAGLAAALAEAMTHRTLRLIVVRVRAGSDPGLGRPTLSPRENVRQFLGRFQAQAE